MQKYFLIAILFFLNNKSINGETFEECEGVPDESFVASKTSCTIYIYCMGEESQYGECDNGQYFDPDALACDAKENVYCALDEPQVDGDAETETVENGAAAEAEEIEPENEPVTETTTVTTITTTTATTTAATTTTIITTTENSMISTPTVDAPSNEIDIITNVPLVKETCPAQDNPNQIILIANNISCSDYYVCYHGHAIQMHCTNYLHFNVATGQCDYPENVKCFESGAAVTEKCLPHVTDFFPHPEKCNYFYYCIRGFLTVQQCPFFYGWDVERRACVQISQAKCYAKK